MAIKTTTRATIYTGHANDSNTLMPVGVLLSLDIQPDDMNIPMRKYAMTNRYLNQSPPPKKKGNK
jgi:hypothetical protein